MLKKILVLLCFASLTFANLPRIYQQHSHNEILKSFDVDRKFIQSFHGNKNLVDGYKTRYFLNVLNRGSNFVPMISKILEEEGIPPIFLYLAMAESNLSPNATSSQRAAGLWQFIQGTALKYGLKINEYIDERRDPIKSTRSAAKYLKDLHSEFGKWYVVAMAYNCGSTRVRKAIKKAGTDDIGTLLDDNKKYIPRETRNYIRKILSLAVMSKKNDWKIASEDDVEGFDVVEISGATSLASIAQSIGVSTNKLKSLNPQLKYLFTPPSSKSTFVYLPSGLKKTFKKNYKPSNAFDGFDVHVVKKGDTLWNIGLKYKVPYGIIKKINNLKTNSISLKQRIIIPITKNSHSIIYVVKNGDTINDISKKFNIQISALIENNKIGEYIKPGDKLVIPKK